jgi:hypothetical protein
MAARRADLLQGQRVERVRALTSCMPCSFGLPRSPRSGAGGPLSGPLGVTVTDRQIPRLTAACGTRVARPARTMMLAPGGDGSQIGRRVRPVLGDQLSCWQAAKGAAASATRSLPNRQRTRGERPFNRSPLPTPKFCLLQEALDPAQDLWLIDAVGEARAGAVGVDHERVHRQDGRPIQHRAARVTKT